MWERMDVTLLDSGEYLVEAYGRLRVLDIEDARQAIKDHFHDINGGLVRFMNDGAYDTLGKMATI